MNEAINEVLTKTCSYDDLSGLVLERMNQIHSSGARSESDSELVHFLLNSVAKLLKKEATFSSVLTAVIELSLPNMAIERAMLDDMYQDERAKMTEHSFDKIALDHYDCKDNWLSLDLKDDAMMKCLILQFRVEMIAAVALHFNSGADADLLQRLQASSDGSEMLKAIAAASSEFAQRMKDVAITAAV